MKLLLDGVDVSGRCRISNSQIRFLAGYDLGSGLHRATMSAFTAAGREFATNWTFTIR